MNDDPAPFIKKNRVDIINEYNKINNIRQKENHNMRKKNLKETKITK